MRPALLLILASLAACDAVTTGGGEEAEALVRAAFDATVKPGPFGTEAHGKGVWFRAPAISTGCLMQKDWGFRDDPGHSPNSDGSPRMSPVFGAQNAWTHATEKGYCIYLGDDLSMEVKGSTKLMDIWSVDVVYSMGRPGGWWECVDPKVKERGIRVVTNAAGELEIDGDAVLYQGGCPAPLPLGMERKPQKPPKGKTKSPTRAEVIAAAKRLDDALYDQDYPAALDAVSCYNLYAEKPYGACAVSELISVGPIPRGEVRMQDGTPWTMNVFRSLDEIGKITPDRVDKTMFHVQVKEAKGKHKARTIAVQKVDDAWKVVGVVNALGEGLTSLRFVYDLDRKEKREIFDRRLAGEKIADDGTSLDPNIRYGYAKPERE